MNFELAKQLPRRFHSANGVHCDGPSSTLDPTQLIREKWIQLGLLPLRCELFPRPGEVISYSQDQPIRERGRALIAQWGETLPAGITVPTHVQQIFGGHSGAPYIEPHAGIGDSPLDMRVPHHSLCADGAILTGETFKQYDVDKLRKKLLALHLTSEGRDECNHRFGFEQSRDEIARNQRNILALLASPEILRSIDMLLIAWNRGRCNDFLENRKLPNNPSIGDSARIVIEIGELCGVLARLGGIELPTKLDMQKVDFPALHDFLAVAKAQNLLQDVARNIDPRERALWRIGPRDLHRDEASGDSKLEVPFESMTLRLKIRGRDQELSLPLPLSTQQLRAFLSDAQDRMRNWSGVCVDGHAQGDEENVRIASIGAPSPLVSAIEDTWPLVPKLLLDFALSPKSDGVVAEAYESIETLVGYLDFISALATKAVMRVASEPNVKICVPSIGKHGEDLPLPIIGTAISSPFHWKNVTSETPNNTYLGAEAQSPVLVVGGLTGGGKTHLLRSIVWNTVQANLGDLVFGESFRFDPAARLIVPVYSPEVDTSGGGWNGTVQSFVAGIKAAFKFGSPVILQDEVPGTLSEQVSYRPLLDMLKGLADKRICTFFFTHNFPLLKMLVEQLDNLPGIDLGHVAFAESEEAVTPLYRIIPGAPPIGPYDRVAMNAAAPLRALFDNAVGTAPSQ